MIEIDESHYKKNHEFIDLIISYLQLPPEERKDKHNDKIMDVIRNEQFLGSLEDLRYHDLKDIASSVTLRKVDKGTDVFRYGE